MKLRQPKIPARAFNDADIQHLPNYVAAEWEKPDYLLVSQRRAMPAYASEFVLKIDPAQVLPQEVIPDFIDGDNITKDSSEGNPNPTVVREVSIYPNRRYWRRPSNAHLKFYQTLQRLFQQ